VRTPHCRNNFLAEFSKATKLVVLHQELSMSELGNTLKKLRGKTTQAELAKACGLSSRTVGRAESGYEIYLDTLRVIAQHYKLSEPEWADLLVQWIRLQLGDEVGHVVVASRYKHKSKSPQEAELDRFMDRFRALPEKYQRELALAVQREEVLRSIVPINELVSRLKAKPV
jgi:transcriptional regulator with XRE-family HTH domain